jgi:hypothetical protein
MSSPHRTMNILSKNDRNSHKKRPMDDRSKSTDYRFTLKQLVWFASSFVASPAFGKKKNVSLDSNLSAYKHCRGFIGGVEPALASSHDMREVLALLISQCLSQSPRSNDSVWLVCSSRVMGTHLRVNFLIPRSRGRISSILCRLAARLFARTRAERNRGTEYLCVLSTIHRGNEA